MPWATVPPLFSAALLRALFADVSSKLWGESVAENVGDETPVGDSSWDPAALTALQAESAAGAGDPGAVQAPGSLIQDVPKTADCVIPECAELKDKYDRCFFRWYRDEYLDRGGEAGRKARAAHEVAAPKAIAETPCEELFSAYKACLVAGLAKSDAPFRLDDTRVTIPVYNTK